MAATTDALIVVASDLPAFPRCLIRLGLDAPGVGLSGGGPSMALARKTGELGASVLDTIAASVGSVPRILLRNTDTGFEPPLIRPAREGGGDGTLRYRIDGEIARGGMGSVLKGATDLGRTWR